MFALRHLMSASFDIACNADCYLEVIGGPCLRTTLIWKWCLGKGSFSFASYESEQLYSAAVASYSGGGRESWRRAAYTVDTVTHLCCCMRQTLFATRHDFESECRVLGLKLKCGVRQLVRSY